MHLLLQKTSSAVIQLFVVENIFTDVPIEKTFCIVSAIFLSILKFQVGDNTKSKLLSLDVVNLVENTLIPDQPIPEVAVNHLIPYVPVLWCRSIVR